MKKFIDTVKKHYIVTTLAMMIVSLLILQFYPSSKIIGSSSHIIKESVLSLVVFLPFAFIVGKKEWKPSLIGLSYTFKNFWWIIAIPLITFLLIVILLFIVPQNFNHNFWFMIIPLFITSLLVGIFEEVLTRGFLLNAFLVKQGKNHKGMVWACFWSGIIFGFIHVYKVFFSPDIFNLMVFLNAIGKTIQVGIIGFVIAFAYLKTENIWIAVILHGVSDYFNFIAAALVTANIEVTSYSEGGLETFIFYIIATIIYIPPAIRAYKQIKTVRVPNYGVFKENWEPTID